MKNTSASIGVAAAALLSASPALADTWDMALAYSATNYHSEIAAEFAAAVTEGTGGELEIVTHPSGSLFAGGEIYGAVRRGLVPIGERLISALANQDPLFEIDSIPFLATGFEASWNLYQASRPALVDLLAEDRVHFLYSCPWPPQGFYSIREANTSADVEGLRFRAYNATTSRLAELLGMSPTQIEAAELAQAFATGVAESMISSGSTGYDRALWEHVDYFYDVQAWLPRNMVIVNAEAWADLDEATQTVINDAAAAAEETCWARAEELAGWYLEQFAANGMAVGTLNDEMQAAFEAAGGELRADWLERMGDRGPAILEAFEAN